MAGWTDGRMETMRPVSRHDDDVDDDADDNETAYTATSC